MAERICSELGCEKKYLARGLCSSHYERARRSGKIKPLPPNPDWHYLSNVDLESKTADCSICGPGVPIRVRKTKGRGPLECGISYRLKRLRRSATGRKLVTEVEFQAMTKDQDGRCAICEEKPEGTLNVDHCHDTGKVRGLLCRRCNFAIGFLRDDAQRALSAAAYLKLHTSPRNG